MQITKKTDITSVPSWNEIVIHLPMEGGRWRLVLLTDDNGVRKVVAHADGKFLRICELLSQLAKLSRKRFLKWHVKNAVQENGQAARDEEKELRKLTSLIEEAP